MRNPRELPEPERAGISENPRDSDLPREPERRPKAVPPRELRGDEKRTLQQKHEEAQSFLPGRQIEEMRSRWSSIQASFVDEPRRAVEEADALVTSAIKMISEGFTDQKLQLEREWSRGEEASTESLRVALQQYRSFFSRLLSL